MIQASEVDQQQPRALNVRWGRFAYLALALVTIALVWGLVLASLWLSRSGGTVDRVGAAVDRGQARHAAALADLQERQREVEFGFGTEIAASRERRGGIERVAVARPVELPRPVERPNPVDPALEWVEAKRIQAATVVAEAEARRAERRLDRLRGAIERMEGTVGGVRSLGAALPSPEHEQRRGEGDG